jgi:hypothetical protein
MIVFLMASPNASSSTAGYRLRLINGIVNNSCLVGISVFFLSSSFRSYIRLFRSPRPLLIIHKTVSFAGLFAAITCRLKRGHIVFDVCDNPFLSLDMLSGDGPAPAFRLIRYLLFSAMSSIANKITVSSQSLSFSFAAPKTVLLYDIFDQPQSVSASLPAPKSRNSPYGSPSKYSILWYGSAGSSNSFQGIDELLHSSHQVHLCRHRIDKFYVVSNLQKSAELSLEDRLDLPQGALIYKKWTPDFFLELLGVVDCVYLPTLDSFKTFYKTENRVAYAVANGLPVICGSRDSYLAYAERNPGAVFCGSLDKGLVWLDSLSAHDVALASKRAVVLNRMNQAQWASFLDREMNFLHPSI